MPKPRSAAQKAAQHKAAKASAAKRRAHSGAAKLTNAWGPNPTGTKHGQKAPTATKLLPKLPGHPRVESTGGGHITWRTDAYGIPTHLFTNGKWVKRKAHH